MKKRNLSKESIVKFALLLLSVFLLFDLYNVSFSRVCLFVVCLLFNLFFITHLIETQSNAIVSWEDDGENHIFILLT